MSAGKGTDAHSATEPGSVSGGDDPRDDAVFKALASPVRRRILDLLRGDPMTTGAVCEAFPDHDRTTILQHIRVLERAELLTGRREGRTRVLGLAPLPIKRIHDRWIGEYAHAAVELLASLDGTCAKAGAITEDVSSGQSEETRPNEG